MGLVTSASLIQYGWGFTCFTVMIYGWFLIVLSFWDAYTHELPDLFTLPLLWLGLLINTFQGFVPLNEAVLGAAFGYGSFFLIGGSYQILMKQPGLGRGDFKLLAALGAWMGWKSLPTILILSSVTGVIFFLIRSLFQRKCLWHQPFAFGPFLAFSGLGIMLFSKSPYSGVISF
ncbi:MAG: prepilin peptidase [Gammaproteobacteria bacterium]|nr:prepilin peptidase [Gammaproteobacteria bacterium]